jgi:hypothetical protein
LGLFDHRFEGLRVTVQYVPRIRRLEAGRYTDAFFPEAREAIPLDDANISPRSKNPIGAGLLQSINVVECQAARNLHAASQEYCV